MAGGNKLAALTGDFLLAKAAGGLSRLNHPQVVDSMAQAIGSKVTTITIIFSIRIIFVGQLPVLSICVFVCVCV